MNDELMLARWIEGDLEPADADALEERLAHEPDLAARADVLADALWALGADPDAEVPEPAALRLRRRLQAETGPGAGTSAGTWSRRPGGRPTTAASSTRTPWVLGGVAAALVLVVALGGLLRAGLGGGGDEVSSANTAAAPIAEGLGPVILADGREVGPAVLDEGAVLLAPPGAEAGLDAQEDAAQEESAQLFDAPGGSSEAAAEAAPESEATADGAGSAEEAAPGSETAAAPPEPEAVAPASPALDEALRARFGGVSEASALLGLDAAQAAEVAGAFRARIAGAGPFADGRATDSCLDDLLVPSGPSAPVPVPVRVERTSIDGAPALVAVLVGATTGAEVLDRVEVWVLDPTTCGVRRYLTH